MRFSRPIGEARRVLPVASPRIAVTAALLGLAHSGLAMPVSPPQASEVGRVRWSVFDEGKSWIPDGVALGDDGSTVFAGVTTAHPALLMYAAGSPIPLLESAPIVGGPMLSAKVAMAASAPVAVSISIHDVGTSGAPDFVAVVRSFDLEGSPLPLWERQLPASDYVTSPGVLVSDDGHVTLTWWSVESLGGMLVTAFDAGGVILSSSVIGSGGILYPEEAALSRDGSVALFSLPVLGRAVVYDPHSGQEVASLPDNGIFSAHAMSADGGRFAAVSRDPQANYRAQVYELDDLGMPVLIFERVHPDSVRVSHAALDLDGSRFAYAVQEIGPEDAFHLELHDLDAGQLLFERTIAAPGTGFQLWCAGLQIDDAGETLACVSWGDSTGLTPEIFALDAHGERLIGVHARGSGQHLSLSRDGELLFAGCKATHANVFGSGGDLYMIETRAQILRLEGQPHLGAELDLSVHADPSFDRVMLLASPELLDAPTGELRLDFTAGKRLIGVFKLANGELETPLSIPDSMVLAGSSAHFQAVLFDDDAGVRELTNKVSLHLLP